MQKLPVVDNKWISCLDLSQQSPAFRVQFDYSILSQGLLSGSNVP